MSQNEISLMAHLLRRAGFGATRDELEAYLAKGYEATVEELLHPGDPGSMPDDVIRRLHAYGEGTAQVGGQWMYRMISTRCPLEDKLALFLHSLFATGYTKLNQAESLRNQIDMFRRLGLGSFHNLLVELSKDPTMILWLDNNDNHNGAINENYGRELLELFAMGIGNYSEEDVKECARAFTGWTLGNADYMAARAHQDSFSPYGRIAWHFQYRAEDHDDGEKTFLGETGRFNGEDIIDIIARHPATARFISGRLFQFFAADEIDESGEQVIETMVRSYFDAGYEIRSVLRTLLNSGYFKSEKVRYARVKGPAELVIGAVRLAGTYRAPTMGIGDVAQQAGFMGQQLLEPPGVEGWHEGTEWIDSGALVERVNFVAGELGNVASPGVRAMIERLATEDGGVLSPAELVDRCLDLMGPVMAAENTRTVLTSHVEERGDLDLRGHQEGDESEKRVGELLRLIASTREFQLA